MPSLSSAHDHLRNARVQCRPVQVTNSPCKDKHYLCNVIWQGARGAGSRTVFLGCLISRSWRPAGFSCLCYCVLLWKKQQSRISCGTCGTLWRSMWSLKPLGTLISAVLASLSLPIFPKGHIKLIFLCLSWFCMKKKSEAAKALACLRWEQTLPAPTNMHIQALPRYLARVTAKAKGCYSLQLCNSWSLCQDGPQKSQFLHGAWESTVAR